MNNLSFHRSLLFMGALTVIGSGVGAYIMGMAVLSPCPLLVNDNSGDVIIVSTLFKLIYSNNYCVKMVKYFLRKVSFCCFWHINKLLRFNDNSIETCSTHLCLFHRYWPGSSLFSLCPMWRWLLGWSYVMKDTVPSCGVEL